MHATCVVNNCIIMFLAVNNTLYFLGEPKTILILLKTLKTCYSLGNKNKSVHYNRLKFNYLVYNFLKIVLALSLTWVNCTNGGYTAVNKMVLRSTKTRLVTVFRAYCEQIT